MSALSGPTVAGLAANAGFRDRADLVTIVAIAKAESQWDPGAVGDTTLANATWGPSYGLWQIRSLNAQKGTGGPRDATRLADPAFNAATAFGLYTARGGPKSALRFVDWTVWKTGAYRKYLPDAEKAVAILTYPTGGAVPGNTDLAGAVKTELQDGRAGALGASIVNPLEGIAAVGKFFSLLTEGETWIRVIEVTAGIGAVTLGAVLIAKTIAPVGTAAGLASGLVGAAS